jgi:hypothetical protein
MNKWTYFSSYEILLQAAEKGNQLNCITTFPGFFSCVQNHQTSINFKAWFIGRMAEKEKAVTTSRLSLWTLFSTKPCQIGLVFYIISSVKLWLVVTSSIGSNQREETCIQRCAIWVELETNFAGVPAFFISWLCLNYLTNVRWFHHLSWSRWFYSSH